MICVVLLGRTGNHLFQYALGRVLAQRHGVPLVMDASWFHGEGWDEVSHWLRLPLQATVVRRASLAARALLKLTGKHYWEFRGVPVIREPVTALEEVLAMTPEEVRNCGLTLREAYSTRRVAAAMMDAFHAVKVRHARRPAC